MNETTTTMMPEEDLGVSMVTEKVTDLKRLSVNVWDLNN
jgi:hypothetical protein